MHSQASSPDLKGLALADLQRMLAQTEAAVAERCVDELKVLGDGFASKLAANAFSVREGIDALKPYLLVKVLPAAGSAELLSPSTAVRGQRRASCPRWPPAIVGERLRRV